MTKVVTFLVLFLCLFYVTAKGIKHKLASIIN